MALGIRVLSHDAYSDEPGSLANVLYIKEGSNYWYNTVRKRRYYFTTIEVESKIVVLMERENEYSYKT